MYVLKGILLICVFCTSTIIGIIISKKYISRVEILKDMKNALNIFNIKLNFSCETIPEIFEEISEKIEGIVGKVFKIAVLNMNEMSAGDAWEQAICNNLDMLKKEDINSLKPLRKTTSEEQMWRGN